MSQHNLEGDHLSSYLLDTTLGLTGSPFWQQESYDRLVRDREEFESIWNYIEQNPVRAGLVREAGEYRWSSAWATGGSPAVQGDRPTIDSQP